MEFLKKNTSSLLDSQLENGNYITAKGKKLSLLAAATQAPTA
jgi:hypothetical protein